MDYEYGSIRHHAVPFFCMVTAQTYVGKAAGLKTDRCKKFRIAAASCADLRFQFGIHPCTEDGKALGSITRIRGTGVCGTCKRKIFSEEGLALSFSGYTSFESIS
ncbi:hypothetical protein R1flu_003435 [Riccia fluitans]|uniref:Uncharacterized protein n=1 Tax=Riccia fluitans TaxID=41844 RepID=A0ABD1Y950_9MARC